MQLALDSNKASNTAILLLPMLLAAAPMALFADVSAAITVAYSIIADVVSVLHVLIKRRAVAFRPQGDFCGTCARRHSHRHD